MKRWIFSIAAACVLLALFVWRFSVKRSQAEETAKAQKAAADAPPNVTVAVAGVRDVVQNVEAVGNVEAPADVPVTALVAGQIQFLNVHEGDHVQKGEVLVRLDPTLLEAQVSQAKQALVEARFRLLQARQGQNPNDVAILAQLRQQNAALANSKTSLTETLATDEENRLAALATVQDADARLRAASAQIVTSDASIASAKASLLNATVRLQRYEALIREGATTRQNVDDATAGVKVAEAALQSAQAQKNQAVAQQESALAQKTAAEREAQGIASKGKADIATARATLAQTQASMDVAQANRGQRGAYQSSIEALSAVARAAQAQLAGAEKQLGDTVLRSPIEGYVTARYLDPGAMAASGQTLLTIENTQHVYITTSLPEEATLLITQNAPAQITFDAVPDRAFTGRLRVINRAADPQSRQFTVRVLMDNPGLSLRSGMFARVTVETKRERSAIVVPYEAIQQGKDEKPVVLVVDADGTVKQRTVKTGIKDQTGVAIRSGLKSGEKVVVVQAGPLKDGKKVHVAETRPMGSEKALVMTYGGGAPHLPAPSTSGGWNQTEQGALIGSVAPASSAASAAVSQNAMSSGVNANNGTFSNGISTTSGNTLTNGNPLSGSAANSNNTTSGATTSPTGGLGGTGSGATNNNTPSYSVPVPPSNLGQSAPGNGTSGSTTTSGN